MEHKHYLNPLIWKVKNRIDFLIEYSNVHDFVIALNRNGGIKAFFSYTIEGENPLKEIIYTESLIKGRTTSDLFK